MSYVLVLMPVVGIAALIIIVRRSPASIPIELQGMLAAAFGIPLAYAGQEGWIRLGVTNTAGAFLLSAGSEIAIATIIWLLWKWKPRILP